MTDNEIIKTFKIHWTCRPVVTMSTTPIRVQDLRDAMGLPSRMRWQEGSHGI